MCDTKVGISYSSVYFNVITMLSLAKNVLYPFMVRNEHLHLFALYSYQSSYHLLNNHINVFLYYLSFFLSSFLPFFQSFNLSIFLSFFACFLPQLSVEVKVLKAVTRLTVTMKMKVQKAVHHTFSCTWWFL